MSIRYLTKPPKNNTSGYPGVSWWANRNKWGAYITARGKKTFLGLFTALTDAVIARKKAEARQPYVYSPRQKKQHQHPQLVINYFMFPTTTLH